MNERINELAEQAGYTPLPGFDFANELQEVFLNKFAELIVRECAKQCTTDGPFGAEVVWGKQFHKKILEHFGVE